MLEVQFRQGVSIEANNESSSPGKALRQIANGSDVTESESSEASVVVPLPLSMYNHRLEENLAGPQFLSAKNMMRGFLENSCSVEQTLVVSL